MRFRILVFTLNFVVIFSTGTFGEEVDPKLSDNEYKTSWGPSYGGLTGYGALISTDILDHEEIRASFQFKNERIRILDRNFLGLTRRDTIRAQMYEFSAAVGLYDYFEASLKLPLIDYEFASNVFPNDQDAGLGNPEISLKAGWNPTREFPYFSFGGYLELQPDFGDPDIIRPRRILNEGNTAEFEIGITEGLHFHDKIDLFANFGYRLFEGGFTPDRQFIYRFGLTGHVLEDFSATMVYDGAEQEGSAGSMGILGFVFRWAGWEDSILEFNYEVLLLDNGYVDVTTTGSGDEAIYFSIGFGFTVRI